MGTTSGCKDDIHEDCHSLAHTAIPLDLQNFFKFPYGCTIIRRLQP